MLVVMGFLAGCGGKTTPATDPTTETDADADADTDTDTDTAGGCGTLYGTDDPGCPILCPPGTYCAACLGPPDTSDTSATSSVEFGCIPCGSAC
jgi:hypothetical protein